MGPDPGSAVSSATKIPVLLALLATVYRARTEVSLEVVWEGAGTRFPHPRDVLMMVLEVRNADLHVALLCTTFYSSQLMFTFILFWFDPYCAIILVLNLACVGPIFLLLVKLLG